MQVKILPSVLSTFPFIEIFTKQLPCVQTLIGPKGEKTMTQSITVRLLGKRKGTQLYITFIVKLPKHRQIYN